MAWVAITAMTASPFGASLSRLRFGDTDDETIRTRSCPVSRCLRRPDGPVGDQEAQGVQARVRDRVSPEEGHGPLHFLRWLGGDFFACEGYVYFA